MQKQTLDLKKIELKEKEKELSKTKVELIKREFQDNLQNYMDNKLSEIVDKLNEIKGGMSTVEIKSLLTLENTVGRSPKYSNTELAILFDYYKKFIQAINRKQRFLPTKNNFCSFIGISSKTYDVYRGSDDEERREIMQMIDDYIVDLQLTSAQNGGAKEITTIFRAKAEHGMIEAQAPIVFEHKSEVNIDNIMKQIEAVNKGKSLKTIELKKQEDGSYRGEE